MFVFDGLLPMLHLMSNLSQCYTSIFALFAVKSNTTRYPDNEFFHPGPFSLLLSIYFSFAESPLYANMVAPLWTMLCCCTCHAQQSLLRLFLVGPRAMSLLLNVQAIIVIYFPTCIDVCSYQISILSRLGLHWSSLHTCQSSLVMDNGRTTMKWQDGCVLHVLLSTHLLCPQSTASKLYMFSWSLRHFCAAWTDCEYVPESR